MFKNLIESFFGVTTTFPGDDDFPVMDVDELSCGDNTPNIPIDVQNNNSFVFIGRPMPWGIST